MSARPDAGRRRTRSHGSPRDTSLLCPNQSLVFGAVGDAPCAGLSRMWLWQTGSGASERVLLGRDPDRHQQHVQDGEAACRSARSGEGHRRSSPRAVAACRACQRAPVAHRCRCVRSRPVPADRPGLDRVHRPHVGRVDHLGRVAFILAASASHRPAARADADDLTGSHHHAPHCFPIRNPERTDRCPRVLWGFFVLRVTTLYASSAAATAQYYTVRGSGTTSAPVALQLGTATYQPDVSLNSKPASSTRRQLATTSES